MALPNIGERRAYVMNLLNEGVNFNYKLAKDVAAIFGCSHSAIINDVHWMTTKKLANAVIYPSQALKKKIYKRDDGVCQYCGKKKDPYVIDHIIPWWQGGVGTSYNLVVACASCNSKKMRCTWIPNNLDAITKDNPEWKQLILSMASGQPSVNG